MIAIRVVVIMALVLTALQYGNVGGAGLAGISDTAEKRVIEEWRA